MRGTRDDASACEILHVDMDAFFASVEVLDDPGLAGRAVIVGGTGSRGVVASCTYEARAFGVRSAMPSPEARRLCPDAVFLAGRYHRYTQVSERLHLLLHEFTPLVEGIGLDEAFLDVSGAHRLFGPPGEVAHRVRVAVREELGLRCCVGVARTKLLAKLASRAAKPRVTRREVVPGSGVVVVPPSDEAAFLRPLPIGALWGVGPSTARRLNRLGVSTVGDLATVREETLCRLLGTAAGLHLAALARGEDPSAVEPSRKAKSVGHEETFPADLRARPELHRHVVRMADAVVARLRESGLRGRTVTIKVRYGDRSTITRSQTLASHCSSARAVAAVAGALLEAVDVGSGVRLLGVTVSSLAPGNSPDRQLAFEREAVRAAGPGFERVPHVDPDVHGTLPREDAWEEVESAVAQVRARYGRSAVGPATLVGPEGISVKRRGDAQWGPDDARRSR